MHHTMHVEDAPGWGFKSRPGQRFGLRFLLHLRPLANSAMMSTMTVHCQWEDETVRERTGHPPSYAKAKKMTLHSSYPWLPQGIPIRDSSSSSSEISYDEYPYRRLSVGR